MEGIQTVMNEKARMNSSAPAMMSGAMPLSMAGRDEIHHVCSIRGKDDVRRFLTNLGFVEQAEVRVISELDGNLIVAIKGARVAVSRSMANRILVC